MHQGKEKVREEYTWLARICGVLTTINDISCPMSSLESKIEKDANTVLEAEGWICEKVKFANSGYPDRFYIHVTGVIVWIEYKKLGRTPYELQEIRLRTLRVRKQNAVWTDNTYDAIWYCRQALVSARVPSGRYQNVAPTGSGRFVPGPWPWELKSVELSQ